MAFTAPGVEDAQRPLRQLRQQPGQILPNHRLADFSFSGAVNITRKFFSNIVKIAILHGQRLR